MKFQGNKSKNRKNVTEILQPHRKKCSNQSGKMSLFKNLLLLFQAWKNGRRRTTSVVCFKIRKCINYKLNNEYFILHFSFQRCHFSDQSYSDQSCSFHADFLLPFLAQALKMVKGSQHERNCCSKLISYFLNLQIILTHFLEKPILLIKGLEWMRIGSERSE